MNGGRVEQIGTPLAIYEEPANTFIARFLGQANLIEGESEGHFGRYRYVCDGRRCNRQGARKGFAPHRSQPLCSS